MWIYFLHEPPTAFCILNIILLRFYAWALFSAIINCHKWDGIEHDVNAFMSNINAQDVAVSNTKLKHPYRVMWTATMHMSTAAKQIRIPRFIAVAVSLTQTYNVTLNFMICAMNIAGLSNTLYLTYSLTGHWYLNISNFEYIKVECIVSRNFNI